MFRFCFNDFIFEECCFCVFDVLFLEEFGLLSFFFVIDLVCGEVIIDFRFLEDEYSWTRLWLLVVEVFFGVVSRFIGVVGGNFLLNCLGLRIGLNEIRLEFFLVLYFFSIDFFFF